MLVRKIDHALLKVDDARAAWELFSGPLALPVAWPPFEYKGFLSGAVALGEANLELLTPLPDADVPAAAAKPGAQVIGVAFEPETADMAVAEMDERGIPHGEPWSYEHKVGGTAVASWTSVDVEAGWIVDCPIVLFVKYDRDQDQVWKQRTAAMKASDGGPLGILGFAEMHPGSSDDASAAKWERLLDGLPVEAGHFTPELGPSITVGKTGASEIVLSVDDIERAEMMANQLGIGGRTSARGLGLTFGGVPLPVRLRDF